MYSGIAPIYTCFYFIEWRVIMVEKNAWVSIRRTILEPVERTGHLPEETKEVPFQIWVKGRLQTPAEIGEEVTVVTRTGRTETGTLEKVNPQYQLNYGDFVEELLEIGDNVRRELFRGDDV